MLDSRSETFKIKLLEFRQKAQKFGTSWQKSCLLNALLQSIGRATLGRVVARIAQAQYAVPVLVQNRVMTPAYYGPPWAPD